MAPLTKDYALLPTSTGSYAADDYRQLVSMPAPMQEHKVVVTARLAIASAAAAVASSGTAQVQRVEVEALYRRISAGSSGSTMIPTHVSVDTAHD